eukprot:874135-Rhodomonas_salina.1
MSVSVALPLRVCVCLWTLARSLLPSPERAPLCAAGARHQHVQKVRLQRLPHRHRCPSPHIPEPTTCVTGAWYQTVFLTVAVFLL